MVNNLTTLPRSISNLKHLRILNISHNTLDIITDKFVNSLRSKMPQLDVVKIEENSPEHIEMRDLELIEEKVATFYRTLDTSNFVFQSFDELQAACEQLVEKEFGRNDDFFDYVRSLREMLSPIQPWN